MSNFKLTLLSTKKLDLNQTLTKKKSITNIIVIIQNLNFKKEYHDCDFFKCVLGFC